ncbi:MAG: methionyl-tRNA formyltransferase [Candidatus Tectomicrobia bacterium]|uniref:Methionyl-tRNA formyltransferase n=1 Tax=Tectimicrobiota bacterium TaxID=2528274 RepID=A0A932CPB5_UNCTE|nr:methionyl-tRNA formyltransferase [Candidatus Tectomicrobia bacterium]
MRLIFMGTSSFALPSLQALAAAGHEIVAVVTQPDKPQGRGQRLAPPPIKELAESLGLPVLQPVKIREEGAIQTLRELAPELAVVVAYGQLLPNTVLTLPARGCINLHASLLPKYRGAGPIAWALLNGEEETGVTSMLIEEALDSGPILLQERVPIHEEDTAGSLHDRLAEIGARLLVKTVEGVGQGRLRPQPQDHEKATYAPKLQKSDGRIDWSRPGRQIYNQIRGLDPWPGAYTSLKEEGLKIWSARPGAGVLEREAGAVISVEDAGILVQTGEGALLLRELQPESRRRMTAKEFLAGHPLSPGARLGE